MIRLPDLAASPSARRAREEIGAAWEQLLAAADQSAHRVGTASRDRGRLARRRATAAALALRGEQPSVWRWWAAGVATGAAIGIVGAVAVGRQVRDAADLRAQAEAAAGTLRQRAGTVTQAAADNARTTIHRARSRFSRGSDDAAADETLSGVGTPDRVSGAATDGGASGAATDGEPVATRQPRPGTGAQPGTEPAG